MKESTVATFLYCDRCSEETEHAINYLNNRIVSIECQACGKRLDNQMDISTEIYTELFTRIKTKPARMSEELHAELTEFLLSLPKRVVSKPFRVLREARKWFGYYKRYHKKNTRNK